MIEIETDSDFVKRILEMMPEGHVYTAEDLGSSHGMQVDAIGAEYGLFRKGLLESQITDEIVAIHMETAALYNEKEAEDYRKANSDSNINPGNLQMLHTKLALIFRRAAFLVRQNMKEGK